MCKRRFLVEQWHLHALWFPEVAVAREEKGAVYAVNWRGKKKVDLHVKFIINLGSSFFFCVELRKVLRSKLASPARSGHWHLLFSFKNI